jgi:Ni,Fe-hydrogenase I small subunit
MSSSWSIQPPTLVGSNYDFWSVKVKSILQGHGCWDCVETGFIEADANVVAAMTVVQRKTLEELKQKEGKAKSYILVSLDDSIFPEIIGAKTAKEAWIFLS